MKMLQSMIPTQYELVNERVETYLEFLKDDGRYIAQKKVDRGLTEIIVDNAVS